MKAKVAVALIFAAGLLVTILAVLRPPEATAPAEPHPVDATPAATVPETPRAAAAKPDVRSRPRVQAEPESTSLREPVAVAVATTNKLERLAQTRESFRALAAGDAAVAMRAAKKIKDETERETALLALVTEWRQGDLRPPQERARAIAALGLEAGLGMELTQNPELAVLWANEMTEGSSRTALLGAAALTLVNSDPAAAFALSDQVRPAERRGFIDEIYAGWAGKDTDAALRWVDQVPDMAERDAALASVRSAAPVGIGAALGMQDGYAVIQQIVPGTPSELSGQLHPGDRIVAVAQGNNSFVDAHSLSLQDIVQMVRGAPGTLLQLQVLASDAPPNSVPRTVPIIRDQIKFKR